MTTAAPGVTKEVFLTALDCRTAGWFVRQQPVAGAPTPGDLLRMEEGKEVGRRARNVFPDGTFVRAQDGAAETKRLMANPKVQTLFEATFHIDGYTARADILRRHGKGWHLIEVKSDTSDKPELLDDLTYTAMVMQRCGVRVTKVSLWLISKGYRLGMADAKLFVEEDHTDDVEDRLGDFLAVWGDVATKTTQPTRPAPALMLACRSCPYFEDECLGKGVEDHIFDLPRLSATKFGGLNALGVTCIANIPEDFDLTENQERVRACVISGKPSVDALLADDLEAVVWPAHYLDFETVMTAIPLYPDLVPYTQVPTQFSVHICSAPGKVVAHNEFLAPDPTNDCRRELAESLLDALRGEGSIVTYSGFEKRVIGELADALPDLAPQLKKLRGRLVDLHAILTKRVYHPGFHGSGSIKATLPVLVPDMSYEGLEIGDGDAAVAAFVKMARGLCSAGETKRIRAALLTYCGQDTMAMVRVHERLLRFT